MSGSLACFFQKPVMTPREPLTSISERRSISRFTQQHHLGAQLHQKTLIVAFACQENALSCMAG